MTREDMHEELNELAWGIIANAYGGDWTAASEEWRDAATRWRDRYLSIPKGLTSEKIGALL